MTSIEEANYRARQASEDNKKEAVKSITRAIDAENAKMEREKKRKFDREVREISKYHGKRASRNPRRVIFRGGDRG